MSCMLFLVGDYFYNQVIIVIVMTLWWYKWSSLVYKFSVLVILMLFFLKVLTMWSLHSWIESANVLHTQVTVWKYITEITSKRLWLSCLVQCAELPCFLKKTVNMKILKCVIGNIVAGFTVHNSSNSSLIGVQCKDNTSSLKWQILLNNV